MFLRASGGVRLPYSILLAALMAATVSIRWNGHADAGEALPARGDSNSDGSIDLTDAVFILNFLFLAGDPPACAPIADTNADGANDLSDGVYVLTNLFLGGPPPPPLSTAELTECGAAPDPAVEHGKLVYATPDPARMYSCATCHNVANDDESEFIKAGSPLHTALSRESYKNGVLTEFIDAANTCREHWMGATTWTEEDQDYQDLHAYLESITPPGPSPNIVFTVVPPAIEGPPEGDAARGCELYHRSCSICHGHDGDGVIVDGVVLGPTVTRFVLPGELVRLKVRLSGPINSIYSHLVQGGFMPFWAREVLSDQDVEDIATWIVQRPLLHCQDDE